MKVIRHLEAVLGIASSFGWTISRLGSVAPLPICFFDEDRFDDARAHIERAKSHAGDDPYYLPNHRSHSSTCHPHAFDRTLKPAISFARPETMIRPKFIFRDPRFVLPHRIQETH